MCADVDNKMLCVKKNYKLREGEDFERSGRIGVADKLLKVVKRAKERKEVRGSHDDYAFADASEPNKALGERPR